MERSIFLGDSHSKAFWDYNHEKIKLLKPDYLLLEVIGRHRFMNKNERDEGKRSEMYIDNNQWQGYNSDAFKLADELDIPMIGIDTWTKPYQDAPGFSNEPMSLSHKIREKQMTLVAKEFINKGNFVLIVGGEHLRDNSELFQFANLNGEVKFFNL